MALEFAAEEYKETLPEKSKQQISETEKYSYHKENTGSDKLQLNTESLIKEIMNRRLNGEDSGRLAYFFHQELSRQIITACVQIRQQSGCNKVALSGGVFQNRLLLELTDQGLKELGFEVLKHRLVPPNDGGIALGQAVYAMEYLEKNTMEALTCV